MGASLHVRLLPRHLNGAMPPAAQALDVAMHIRSGPRGAGPQHDQSATQRENPGSAVGARLRLPIMSCGQRGQMHHRLRADLPRFGAIRAVSC